MENLNLKTIYQWPMKRQVYIFAVAGVLVFMLGYWWDISSQGLKLANARKQEDYLKDEVASTINREQKVKANAAKVPGTEAMLSQWKNQLTLPAKVPETLNAILKTGSNSHLYFGLFDPQAEDTTHAYPVIPVKVVVAGNYHQLGDFINQIANLPMLIKIGALAISRENKPEVLGKELADLANSQNLLTAAMDLEIGILQEKTPHAH